MTEIRGWAACHRWELGLLLVGLALRLAAMPHVAVNDDSGRYLYDALQLTWGSHFFIDFPSRSPVFTYLLAGVVSLVEPHHRIEAARVMMAVIGTVLGLSTYLLAREIANKNVAIGAMALVLVMPFPIVWGAWIKTEQLAAVFVVLGIWLGFRHIDAEDVSPWVGAAVGVLFALAAFSRRIAVIHALVFAVFALVYRWRRGRSIGDLLPAVLTTVLAGVGTSVLITLITVDFQVQYVVPYFQSTLLRLVFNAGGATLPWQPFVGESLKPLFSQRPDPGFWSLFGCEYSHCRRITDIFAKTGLLTLPAMLPLLVWVRIGSDRLPRLFSETIFITIFVYSGSFITLSFMFDRKLILPFALITITAVLVWFVDVPDWRQTGDGRLIYPAITIGVLALAYTYRGRVVFITYFQDFYPFVAVLAAAGAVSFWKTVAEIEAEQRRMIRAIAVGVLGFAVVASFLWTMPYPLGATGISGSFMPSDVEEIGQDMEQRVGPNERVFTAQPLVVIESDRKLVGNLSRKWLVYIRFEGSEPTRELTDTLISDIESGAVPIAVMSDDTGRMLNRSPGLKATFDQTFCRVPEEGVYERTAVTLYIRCSAE